MIKKIIINVIFFNCLVHFFGCTSKSIEYGTIGAFAGAALGSTMGHKSNAFAMTQGAIVGGAIGGAIGSSSEYSNSSSYGNKQLIVICPTCDIHVDVSDFPAHSTVECPKCLTHFTY